MLRKMSVLVSLMLVVAILFSACAPQEAAPVEEAPAEEAPAEKAPAAESDDCQCAEIADDGAQRHLRRDPNERRPIGRGRDVQPGGGDHGHEAHQHSHRHQI